MAISDDCPDRVRSVLDSLQIPLDVIKARSLALQPEAENLVAQIEHLEIEDTYMTQLLQQVRMHAAA